MKVLYIDQHMTGHHIPFLKTLLKGAKNNQVILLTNKNNTSQLIGLVEKIYGIEENHLWGYINFCIAFIRVVLFEKPDIIHFLCGDDYVNSMLMGIGLVCKSRNVIMTIHKFHPGKNSLKTHAWRIIYKRLAWVSKTIVVQTDSIQKKLQAIGVNNTKVIDYPNCYDYEKINFDNKILSLKKENCPILLSIGATRYDKGLDILLEAIKLVKGSFMLIIAGKEDYFKRAFIEKETQCIADSMYIDLRYLTDAELLSYIEVSDYIVIPYRKCFDGQSGPLNEGVGYNKVIIGPNHGSLGSIIEENHLGYVFESENSSSLAQTIEYALKNEFSYDQYYRSYQLRIKSSEFQKNYNELYIETNKKKK